jgi:hypothetical protein
MSFEAPLYAIATASAMIYIELTSILTPRKGVPTGENAMRKSSFRLAFDCCATSNHSLVQEHWSDLQGLYR